ncbi:uncharacterized protein LOC122067482 [Macadamia integrifolia]|uniref:uncharacterized protein LOC122067482 n=1 Tax=Macadamia integrifolia TaxID=60698 RepID=UPI001C4F14A2|nr:uncharacterized protein LOC122067482 [Macadamia integrifolia]
MEKFQKYRPPYFSGVSSDPLPPSKWVDGIQKTLAVLGCNDEQKIMCATYQLQNEAYAWWKATRPILLATHPYPTWDQYVEVFYGNYFPISVTNRKELEFMALTQGPKSVLEYQQQFEDLYCFSLAHMKNDSAKTKKFEKGLKYGIGAMLVAHRLQNYVDVVHIAKSIEDKQRECYQIQAARRTRTGSTGRQFGRFGRGASSSATTTRQRADGALCNILSSKEKFGEQSVTSSSSAPTKKSQATGKVFFALTIEESKIALRVVIGIVFVSNIPAYGHRKKAEKMLISAIQVQKLLEEGCEAYLACVQDTTRETAILEELEVVKEFSDVFPEDLCSVHLDRETEFCIDLVTGATPVSKAPYSMVPTELKELKEQL